MINVAFGAALIVNDPSALVTALALDPFTLTVTPGKEVSFSLETTLPVIRLLWAMTEKFTSTMANNAMMRTLPVPMAKFCICLVDLRIRRSFIIAACLVNVKKQRV
jgi:Flp pilus assembly protein TadG